MNSSQLNYSKNIWTNWNFIKYCIIVIFFIIALFLSYSTAFAGALECSPSEARINRNLKFVGSDAEGNDLYLDKAGSNIYFDNASTGINKYNNDLLFNNGASGGYLFNKGGNTGTNLAKIDNSGNLTATGTINGKIVQGNDQLCIGSANPTSATCLTSGWNQLCNLSGNPANCGTVSATSFNGTNTVCIQGDCKTSWAQAVNSVNNSTTGITQINNTFTGVNTFNGVTTFLETIKSSKLFQVCDAAGNNCVGTGRGVSKIIAGTGITISSNPLDGNPSEGEGDVTVSANAPSLPKVDFSNCTELDHCANPNNDHWTTCTTDYPIMVGIKGKPNNTDLQICSIRCCKLKF